MKVLALTHSISRLGGGIPAVIWGLYPEMKVDWHVFGIRDRFTDEDIPAPVEKNVYSYSPFPGINPLKFCTGIKRAVLRSVIEKDTVIHSHGIWLYPSYVSLKVGVEKKVPEVISPHGMLDGWAVGNSKWKKKLVASLFENKHLNYAKCIHVGSENELAEIRNYGLSNPVAIISNGVDIPASNIYEYPFPPEWKDKKVLLFLSRLHPKKGCDQLLRAWMSEFCSFSDWRLAIVGIGEKSYEESLHNLVDSFSRRDSIAFLPPHYGEKKNACFKHASAYILPSFSEGVPMTVLDAFSFQLPVMASRECNIPDAFNQSAACVWPLDEHSQGRALSCFLNKSQADLTCLSEKGRELSKTIYSWKYISSQMLDVYNWVLEKGDKPDCVVLS